MRVAVNGFGRIGKNFVRALLVDKKALEKITLAVINVGRAEPAAAALSLKYDTLLGTYPGIVEYRDGHLYVDDLKIEVISQLDPEKAPWDIHNIDWVVEASGCFIAREGAEKHLTAGAKAVLITAPARDEDITIIPGVNEETFNSEQHKIVSLGSCTTNALYPMLKVIKDAFGIQSAFMSSVHAYTNTQALLDVDPCLKDIRKSRAAALNIVPTTTGAMKLVDRLMPDLVGKLAGCALRVPVGKVSIIDLTVTFEQEVSAVVINDAYKTAAQGPMKGIISFCTDPLVSSDYAGNDHSVCIDGLMTKSHGSTAKIFGWYDNEWAYSVRLKDFLLITGS